VTEFLAFILIEWGELVSLGIEKSLQICEKIQLQFIFMITRNELTIASIYRGGCRYFVKADWLIASRLIYVARNK